MIKKHLKKLNMPAKKAKPEDNSSLELDIGDLKDHGDDSASADDSADHPEMSLDDMKPQDENDPMAKCSDEDLIAEIKKRGLMSELENDQAHPEDAESAPAPEDMGHGKY